MRVAETGFPEGSRIILLRFSGPGYALVVGRGVVDVDMTIVDADATDALGVGDGQDFMAPAGADREAAFVVGDVYSVAGGVGGDWESVVFAKAG